MKGTARLFPGVQASGYAVYHQPYWKRRVERAIHPCPGTGESLGEFSLWRTQPWQCP